MNWVGRSVGGRRGEEALHGVASGQAQVWMSGTV
jgi:hypothetical protein